jgi:hypothetical protein
VDIEAVALDHLMKRPAGLLRSICVEFDPAPRRAGICGDLKESRAAPSARVYDGALSRIRELQEPPNTLRFLNCEGVEAETKFPRVPHFFPPLG